MHARRPRRTRSSISIGDLVKVERRYVMEGSITSVTDQGRFQGVQVFGSLEHLVLQDKRELRLIPLASVSEITLVRAAPARADPAPEPAYDPSFQ